MTKSVPETLARRTSKPRLDFYESTGHVLFQILQSVRMSATRAQLAVKLRGTGSDSIFVEVG
jgi:hypothetical protein